MDGDEVPLLSPAGSAAASNGAAGSHCGAAEDEEQPEALVGAAVAELSPQRPAAGCARSRRLFVALLAIAAGALLTGLTLSGARMPSTEALAAITAAWHNKSQAVPAHGEAPPAPAPAAVPVLRLSSDATTTPFDAEMMPGGPAATIDGDGAGQGSGGGGDRSEGGAAEFSRTKVGHMDVAGSLTLEHVDLAAVAQDARLRGELKEILRRCIAKVAGAGTRPQQVLVALDSKRGSALFGILDLQEDAAACARSLAVNNGKFLEEMAEVAMDSVRDLRNVTQKGESILVSRVKIVLTADPSLASPGGGSGSNSSSSSDSNSTRPGPVEGSGSNSSSSSDSNSTRPGPVEGPVEAAATSTTDDLTGPFTTIEGNSSSSSSMPESSTTGVATSDALLTTSVEASTTENVLAALQSIFANPEENWAAIASTAPASTTPISTESTPMAEEQGVTTTASDAECGFDSWENWTAVRFRRCCEQHPQHCAKLLPGFVGHVGNGAADAAASIAPKAPTANTSSSREADAAGNSTVVPTAGSAPRGNSTAAAAAAAALGGPPSSAPGSGSGANRTAAGAAAGSGGKKAKAPVLGGPPSSSPIAGAGSAGSAAAAAAAAAAAGAGGEEAKAPVLGGPPSSAPTAAPAAPGANGTAAAAGSGSSKDKTHDCRKGLWSGYSKEKLDYCCLQHKELCIKVLKALGRPIPAEVL